MGDEYMETKKLAPTKLHYATIVLTIIMAVISLYLIFIWSAVQENMGPVQKIFYFHVASAWNAFFAFFIVFIFSILFLLKRKGSYDIIAGISAEVGVVFTALVLITGPIWAHSAWNTWWVWEPRLTTTLILFFMYLAYLVLRQLGIEWGKRANLTAVFGIISFINVPIVYMSIDWWGAKYHPQILKNASSSLDPTVLITLICTILTFTLIYFSILQQGLYVERIRVQENEHKIKGEDNNVS
ncbi:MAG TPA: cytochrome c biogenesis protein [Pseudogracilibacillus sp.]|nr:cytochrome c biogenesis protein [Pseudogracilibacillus sp.]